MPNNIEILLTKLFSPEELDELRNIQLISDSEKRQAALKNFFITPARFEVVKPHMDPVWLSYEIFINKAPGVYEFRKIHN